MEKKDVLCQVCGVCHKGCGNSDINCVCDMPPVKEKEEKDIKIANYFLFLSAAVYHINNPKSKMNIPNMIYEAIEEKVKHFPKDRVMTEQEALKLAGRK